MNDTKARVNSRRSEKKGAVYEELDDPHGAVDSH
jgi:hypothetical protein